MFNLHIHNFRSFQKQTFKFSRINILIGENSGGKSSLLKLLLALKQTAESPHEVNLKLKGDYTDLGNFEEVVYYKKKGRKIVLEFEDSIDYHNYFLKYITPLLHRGATKKSRQQITEIINSYQVSKTKVKIEISSKLNEHSALRTTFVNDQIGSLTVNSQKGNEYSTNRRHQFSDLVFEFKKETGKLENCIAFKEGFFTIFDASFNEQCEDKFPKNSEYVFYSIAYFLVFQNYIQDQIEKIRFVNPIRTSPKRFYFQEDIKSDYKSIDIEKFINVLSDKSLSDRQYKERMTLINKTISHFGIAEEISIIKNKILPVLALNVRTKDFWSNITDVGYGVSLQIPILFQALISEHYAKNGEILLIEQPEVHLHPTLQAKFIETLLSIGSKNTYLIETHSEHIIRKLQVLVKNKTFGLTPEDVSIYYFKREELKFNISEHRILENGKLEPQFPEGFYDTSYNLVKQLF